MLQPNSHRRTRALTQGECSRAAARRPAVDAPPLETCPYCLSPTASRRGESPPRNRVAAHLTVADSQVPRSGGIIALRSRSTGPLRDRTSPGRATVCASVRVAQSSRPPSMEATVKRWFQRLPIHSKMVALALAVTAWRWRWRIFGLRMFDSGDTASAPPRTPSARRGAGRELGAAVSSTSGGRARNSWKISMQEVVVRACIYLRDGDSSPGSPERQESGAPCQCSLSGSARHCRHRYNNSQRPHIRSV